MVTASVEDSTKHNYDGLINDFLDFCDRYGRDPYVAKQRTVQEYICYLYKFTEVPHGAADKRLTALGYFWTCHGCDWDRKKFPTISKMMKGYRRLKPSDLRVKNPFTFIHFKKAMKWINLNTYNGLLTSATLSIGYFYGGRISEYSPKSRDEWGKVIKRNDLMFIGAPLDPSALIIDFRFHKTNKFGIYCGKVECICSCDTGICPVHIIFKFIQWREREYGPMMDQPLLVSLKEKPIPQHQVNFCIKNLIIKMGLDPNLYSSHSLRSGRATDLARALKPSWFIKKWGRWRSDVWQDFYVKLDFSDMAKLSQLSLHQLGIVDNDLMNSQL